jgi:glutamate/tyrosine decarboxylase-like PLP-dependent enzyme
MLVDAIQAEFERVENAVKSGPFIANVTPEEIRSYLASHYDFAADRPLDEVASDVERMLLAWQVHVTHPRYFGLFNPSVTQASVVGDTLAALYNPQLAAWRTSPAANEIERHTLGWLTAKFGLPAESLATFTSGGAEANLSAAIVALTRAFPGYGEVGVRGAAAQPTIYLTEETHHSFNKIAHMTGLGRRALRPVARGRDWKIDLVDLERRVTEDRRSGLAPFMVIGTCGTTVAGAIDPLPELGRLCREQGLWFHVDAAWGGAAILSPTLKHHLAGIEMADSITCDAHKWFSVPMGCGMFFCRHAESVAQSFHAEVSYMPAKTAGDVFDPYTYSVQWSRRFIGLKLFMALAQLGESGYASMIEHQARMGRLLRELLIASGWRIANSSPLPLVCFTRDGLDTTAFLTSLKERQIVWMSEALLGGERIVRACITSFKTTEADVRWVVDEMNQLVSQTTDPVPASA